MQILSLHPGPTEPGTLGWGVPSDVCGTALQVIVKHLTVREPPLYTFLCVSQRPRSPPLK